MLDLGLTGKRALVAGAGHRPPRPGFGRVVSLKLAQGGARVACLDVDEGRAKATAAEVTEAGGEAVPIVADLTDRAQVARAVDEAVAALGGIDIAVDIVGGARWGSVLDFDDEDWDWTLDHNLRQNFLFLQAVARQMVAQGSGGSLVSVASVDGTASSRLHVAYGAAKAGVISMAKTFGEELGPYGIRVNAVAPGGVGSGNEGEESTLTQEHREPLGPPRTRDIANAIIFFCSELSERVTGQTLLVDGGLMTMSPFAPPADLDAVRAFSRGM